MRKIILTFLLSTVVAMPALAQSKKELAATDAALAERLSRLEQRFLTGDPAAVELMQRMDSLESEQRSLTGEIEQLRFERDQLKAEIVALNEDLKKVEALEDRVKLHLDAVDLVARERQQQAQRQSVMVSPSYPSQSIYDGSPNLGSVGSVDMMGTQPSQVPGPPTSRTITVPVDGSLSEAMNQPRPSVSQPLSSAPNLDDLPRDGVRKLNEGNFTGAQSDFQTYLAVAPDAPNAGEVSYWLGETHFVKGSYADAADAYISSMKKDPQGMKAPEALIRLAASLRELGNQGEACRALDSFTSQFPSAGSDIRQKMRDERARTGC